MLDKWNVYNKKEYVGVLIYDEEKKTFDFELKNRSEKAMEAYHNLNADKDQKWFRDTIFDRVFPPNRVNARELLRVIGLLEYDAWEIVKYVQLVSCNDLIWMTKNNDPEEFYKVHTLGGLIKEKEEKRRKQKTVFKL